MRRNKFVVSYEHVARKHHAQLVPVSELQLLLVRLMLCFASRRTSSLTKVAFGDKKIHDVDLVHLNPLTKLTSLQLEGTEILSNRHLKGLVSLETLDLENARVKPKIDQHQPPEPKTIIGHPKEQAIERPLDRVIGKLELAHRNIQNNIKGYSCTLVIEEQGWERCREKDLSCWDGNPRGYPLRRFEKT